jgi:hypothetical protein
MIETLGSQRVVLERQPQIAQIDIRDCDFTTDQTRNRFI